jgi:hypothetical protein
MLCDGAKQLGTCGDIGVSVELYYAHGWFGQSSQIQGARVRVCAIVVIGGSHQSLISGRPHCSVVSRRNKRFILNEDELVRKARKMGIETHILPLEHMSPYEQLRAFRTVNILFGVHGSGLTNAVLLQPGGVMVQIVPYGLDTPIGTVCAGEREREMQLAHALSPTDWLRNTDTRCRVLLASINPMHNWHNARISSGSIPDQSIRCYIGTLWSQALQTRRSWCCETKRWLPGLEASG